MLTKFGEKCYSKQNKKDKLKKEKNEHLFKHKGEVK